MLNPAISQITQNILDDPDYPITLEEAGSLASLAECHFADLMLCTHRITRRRKGADIFTCTIVNAKSGQCSQDCAFCAQSARHRTEIPTYPLMTVEEMLQDALRMNDIGATHFSMVTSGYRLADREIEIICETTSRIKHRTNLLVCCSLGMLSPDHAKQLAQSGITCYHHNLESAQSHYPAICTTHEYEEHFETIRNAREAGMRVCSGGILGLGETWEQRVEMAFCLKRLDVDRVPLNFLNPIAGTRLAHRPLLHPVEALCCIALFRFILPAADITICGGREKTLVDFQSFVFMAGANGLMIGNYLTTAGRNLQIDLDMIRTWLSISG